MTIRSTVFAMAMILTAVGSVMLLTDPILATSDLLVPYTH